MIAIHGRHGPECPYWHAYDYGPGEHPNVCHCVVCHCEDLHQPGGAFNTCQRCGRKRPEDLGTWTYIDPDPQLCVDQCGTVLPGEGGIYRRASEHGWARVYAVRGVRDGFRCPDCRRRPKGAS